MCMLSLRHPEVQLHRQAGSVLTPKVFLHLRHGLTMPPKSTGHGADILASGKAGANAGPVGIGKT